MLNTQSLNLTNVAVIGKMGVGKSSTCKSLCDCQNPNEYFRSSSSIDPCTQDTKCYLVNWKNTQDLFQMVDTPGMHDKDEIDYSHRANMVIKLQQLGYVNACLIIFNARELRLDQATKNMLKLFKEIFKKEFFKNVGFVFTNWARSTREKAIRQAQELSETKIVLNFNNELVNLGIRNVNDDPIECFFLDNSLNQFSYEQLNQIYEQQEIKDNIDQVIAIRRFTESKTPFPTCDFKNAISEHQETRQKLEQAERNNEMLQKELIIEKNKPPRIIEHHHHDGGDFCNIF